MPPDGSWMDAMPSVAVPGQPVAPVPGPRWDHEQGVGTLPDGSATRDPAVFARWAQEWQPQGQAKTEVVGPGDAADTAWMDAMPAVASPHGDEGANGTKGGVLANAGAGTSNAVAGFLGLPVDLATGAINLGTRSVNALAGTHIPPIENPAGGSDDFRTLFGTIGADPRTVEPTNQLERIARAGGEGAASMMLPWGAARSLPALSGLPGAMQSAFGSGGAPTMAASGLTGGALGQDAQDSVPEPWKPLASVVGNIVGGAVPIALSAGATAARQSVVPAVKNYFAPMTQSGQQQIAGSRIAHAATDVGAVRDALAAPSPEIVPGSQPTTFQLTGDQGLGNLERAVSTAAPDQFNGRAAQQNAARVGQLNAQAPATSPDAVGTTFRQALAAMDTQHAAQAEAMGTTARAKTAALGGAVPVGTDAQTTALQGFGQRLRKGLSELNDAARQRVSKLYDAVDPEGTMTVDMSGIKAAAKDIAASVPKNAAPMEGDAGKLLGVAQMQPEAQPFREVAALRSRITDAMRAELYENGRSQTYRTLTRLLASVDETLAAGAEKAAETAPEAVAARVHGATTTAPGTGDAVFTPSGRQIGVRYRVVSARDLVASHNDDFSINPAFPPELQPRARERLASQAQVQRIAGNIQPERLGASASAMEGAPIIGPDGVVESGNARVMALRRAYAQGGESAARYRAWLESQGHDLTGIDDPVLVRERTTDLAPRDRVSFTQESNVSPGLAMGAAEQAKVDAGKIPDGLLELWQPGDVDSAANRKFVRGFAQHVVDAGETGKFFTEDGAPSLEGAQRIRNALMHRAYGDSGLVAALSEVGDENIKAFGGALTDAAGDMAKLSADIGAGRVDPGTDITKHLLDAARVIGQARQRRISIKDMVGQTDMLTGRVNPLTESVLRAAYGDNLTGAISRKNMAELLAFYAEEARKQTTDARLFGGGGAGPADIIQQGIERARAKSAPVRTRDIFGRNGSYGPSAGAVGSEAGGSGAGAARQGNAATALAIAPEEALSPNFDAEAAARYRAANAAHANRVQTFEESPGVGQVLATGKRAGEWRLGDSQVAAQIFNPGKGAAERVQAFLKAGGDRADLLHDLRDYAAFSLRRAAEDADGTLIPAKAARWMNAHREAMTAFPDLAAKFHTAAAARATLDETMARHAAERTAFEKSAAGKFLGDADPVPVVARILRSDTADATMQQLGRMTANAPAARAGLQRAVIDHIMNELRTNAAAGTTDIRQMKADAFQTFLRRAGGPMSHIFSPEQMAAIRDVATDIQRTQRSVIGTKLPGGSNTAQDLAAGVTHGGGKSSMVGMLVAAEGLGDLAQHVTGLGKIGKVGGMILAPLTQAMRGEGLAKVDDLVTQAMLHPELARALLAKVPPGQFAEPVVRNAARQIWALAGVSAIRSQRDPR